MADTTALMLSQSGGAPFHSFGYLNHAIGPILSRNGWNVRSFEPPRNGLGEEAMLPYGLAGQISRLDDDAPPHIACTTPPAPPCARPSAAGRVTTSCCTTGWLTAPVRGWRIPP